MSTASTVSMVSTVDGGECEQLRVEQADAVAALLVWATGLGDNTNKEQ